MKRIDWTKGVVAVGLGLACAMPVYAQSTQADKAPASTSGNASGGQTTDLNASRENNDRDWGWIGLLGLAGLLGLRRRNDTDYSGTRRTT